MALARTGDRLLAYVADADSRSIHTVSIDDQRELVRTRVSGAPRQLVVLDDGRLVATLSDGTHLAVLEPAEDASAPLATLCEREVPAEPWGLALSPNDKLLVVTSAFGAAVTTFDTSTMARQRTVSVARDPRSVLVDDDGVAFVSHLVGAKLSRLELAREALPELIDLGAKKSGMHSQVKDMLVVRSGAQGYALARVVGPGGRRVLAPMVSVDPGDSERASSSYYGPPFDGVPKESPIVSVVDPASKRALGKTVLGATDIAFARECLLPRAATVREEDSTLLVACYGIDSLLELDALAVDPFRAERRRFAVGAGPEGVAVDPSTKRAVVFSQLAGTVTVVDLGAPAPKPTEIALDYRPDPALFAAARGRQLFYRTDDTRVSNDGIACASCHPDGRDDGNTWTTPLGPRQTPMLAGRLAGTAPYGWEGDQKTLADYIGRTVVRLGGKGLAQPELDDLASFVVAVSAPPRARANDALVARGGALFDSEGCSTCHAGESTTDSKVHDLGDKPHDYMTAADTPSLGFVRGTAPYFHDGRYASLEDLLDDPKSEMGLTFVLSAPDRAALAAYLRTR